MPDINSLIDRDERGRVVLPRVIVLSGNPSMTPAGIEAPLDIAKIEDSSERGLIARSLVELYATAVVAAKPTRNGFSLKDSEDHTIGYIYNNVRRHRNGNWSGTLTIVNHTLMGRPTINGSENSDPRVEFFIENGRVRDMLIKWQQVFISPSGNLTDKLPNFYKYIWTVLSTTKPNNEIHHGSFKGLSFSLNSSLNRILNIGYMTRSHRQASRRFPLRERISRKTGFHEPEYMGFKLSKPNKDGNFIFDPYIDRENPSYLDQITVTQDDAFYVLAEALCTIVPAIRVE